MVRLTPPSAPSVPVFGSLPFIGLGKAAGLGPPPHIRMAQLAERYGDVMELKMGRAPWVVLSSPSAVHEAFVLKGDAFSGRPMVPSMSISSGGGPGCGCTETCPVTRDRRASRRLHVPAGRSGRLRGARSLEVSFHRPLVRRAGWRLVPACGNKEVDAYRSIDELARSGGYWVEALHRSHIESGDFMGASRPRARSVPRTSVWGRPLGTGVQVGGRGVYLWFAKPSQTAWGGSWQSARAVLVDHRYTTRRASDPSLVPLHALGRRPLADDGAYLWSPGTGPFGPLGPPRVGVGVWATIGRVGHLLDTSRAVW